MTCIAAKRLNRPVKYQETRTESNQAAMHGRDQIDVVEAAVKPDGKVLGIKVNASAISAPTTSSSRRSWAC